MGKTLGSELNNIRKIKGMQPKAVAEAAKISIAYLKKLEAGEVQQPSPHVLHRLADVLDFPYARLMEMAGYIVPSKADALIGNTVDHALNSSDLTEEERKAVAAFIAHLRAQRD